LVGINTAIFSTGGGNTGVGFAIPVKIAKSVMNSLIKHGKVIRGWLGVSIQDITPELAEYFGLKKATGALISDLLPNSPAEKAGLRQKDVVVAFNGKPVQDATILKNLVAAAVPGSTASVTVIRDKEKKQLKVVLGELPAEVTQEDTKAPDTEYFYGAQLQNLTPELRSELAIPDTVKGVLVTDVEAGSQAEDALREKDVIIQVNRKNIGDLRSLQNISKKLKGDQDILLLVYRDGGNLFLTLTP
jgi:serine protease Do